MRLLGMVRRPVLAVSASLCIAALACTCGPASEAHTVPASDAPRAEPEPTGGSESAPGPGGALARSAPPDPTFGDLVRTEGARLCAAGPLVDLGPDWALACDELTARSARAGEAPLEALVVDFIAGGQIWSVLAVRGAGETRVATLASGWAPGVGGHSAEGATSVEARDLVPGGAPEIVATFSGVAGDSDMGSCDHVGFEVTVHVLCSVDSGALACVSFPSRSMHVEEHTLCGDVSDADGDGDREEPLRGEVETRRRRGFELAVELSEGAVRLTPTPEWPASEEPPVSGVVPIAELFGRAGMAWTASSTPVRVLAR